MKRSTGWLWLTVGLWLLSSCYSLRNTAKVNTSTRGAYIAPKSNVFPINDPQQYISTGAFYADGTMRLGMNNVYLNKKTGAFTVKYLAEEQPDLGSEFLRSLKGSLKLSNEKSEGSASFIDSLSSKVMDITHKSNSLNLARSILYRFNENNYNGVSNEVQSIYVNEIVPKLIGLQNNEFTSQQSESAHQLQLKRYDILLNLDKIIKTMKDNNIDPKDIQDFIKNVTEQNKGVK